MLYQFSVPSKTFLLGEYAALHGSESIILSTTPRFILTAKKSPHQQQHIHGIMDASPAGKLYTRERDFFANYEITFVDPHQGGGGLGASTAQFLLLSALKRQVRHENLSVFDLLQEYIHLAWDGIGVPPSGADLIGQLYGQVCFFHKAEKVIANLEWPFPHIYYSLIHTLNKIPTHLHLKALPPIDSAPLAAIAASGWHALQNKNDINFIRAINHYNEALQELNLLSAQTLELISQLPPHYAAKGCGALGADVLLVLHDKAMEAKIIAWAQKLHLPVIAHDNASVNGLLCT